MVPMKVPAEVWVAASVAPPSVSSHWNCPPPVSGPEMVQGPAASTRSLAAIQAFQGMLLFFLLALDVLSNYRIKTGREATA